MAKRKNSTALFEVIRQVEPYGKTRSKPRDVKADGPSLVDRAKLWLKSKLDVTKVTGGASGRATPESMAANPHVNKSPIGKIVSKGNGNAGAASRLAATQRAIAAEVAASASSQPSNPVSTNYSAAYASNVEGERPGSAHLVQTADRDIRPSKYLGLQTQDISADEVSAEEVLEMPAVPLDPYPAPASESAIAPLVSKARHLDLPNDPTESEFIESESGDEPSNYRSSKSTNAIESNDARSEVYDDVTSKRSSAPMAVAVDSHRKKISLHMSYKGALAAAAALLLTIMLSIVVGQKISKNGSPLLSKSTTTEIRKGPARPEVLNPPPRGFSGENVALRHTAPIANQPANNPLVNKPSVPEQAAFTPPVAEDGKRYIGYNYAIIQGYPVSEEKMARDAVQFLNREGVRCTIENGIRGYQQITIVGLDGFPRVSSSDWIAYKQKIQQLSNKYTADKRGFKAFNPTPKKWDKIE